MNLRGFQDFFFYWIYQIMAGYLYELVNGNQQSKGRTQLNLPSYGTNALSIQLFTLNLLQLFNEYLWSCV